MHPNVKAAHNRGRLQRRPRPHADLEYVVWGKGFQPVSVKSSDDYLYQFASSDIGVLSEVAWCGLEFENDHYTLERYVPLVMSYIIEGLSDLEDVVGKEVI